MAKEFGLGRGLGALIPDAVSLADTKKLESGLLARASESVNEKSDLTNTLVRLPVEKIIPNPEQPRKNFDPEAITELSNSILANGLIQPLIVKANEGGDYLIIAGERRWRAAKQAGLAEVPAVIISVDNKKIFELALIENIQREDLNPYEEADGYRKIMELTGCTQEELAEKTGKGRPTIANFLRLLKLPGPALDALKNGSLTAGHARAVLAGDNQKIQLEIFERITKEELTVRAAENLAAELNAHAHAGGGNVEPAKNEVNKKAKPEHHAELRHYEQSLIDAFGSKVSINGTVEKGSVIIEYYSQDDLERILDIAGK